MRDGAAAAPESITKERPRERPSTLVLSTGIDQRASVGTKAFAVAAAATKTRRRSAAPRILRRFAWGL